MEKRELSGYLKSVSVLQTHEITNQKSQKNKVVSSVLYNMVAWQIFTPRKNKQNKHSQNKCSFI